MDLREPISRKVLDPFFGEIVACLCIILVYLDLLAWLAITHTIFSQSLLYYFFFPFYFFLLFPFVLLFLISLLYYLLGR